MIIRFALDDIPVQGRVSRGVRAMRLAAGDSLAWAGP